VIIYIVIAVMIGSEISIVIYIWTTPPMLQCVA